MTIIKDRYLVGDIINISECPHFPSYKNDNVYSIFWRQIKPSTLRVTVSALVERVINNKIIKTYIYAFQNVITNEMISSGLYHNDLVYLMDFKDLTEENML